MYQEFSVYITKLKYLNISLAIAKLHQINDTWAHRSEVDRHV